MLFALVLISAAGFAQAEPGLQSRLDAYLAATKRVDVDALMELVYPRVFTLAPKADMKTAIRQAFSNAEMKMEIDSLVVDSIHRTLTHQAGRYVKIDYAFLLKMKFGADSTGHRTATRALPVMGKTFGAGNVRIDPVADALVITRSTSMVAIKNSYSKDWTFIELKKNDPLTLKLLSQEILTKLESY